MADNPLQVSDVSHCWSGFAEGAADERWIGIDDGDDLEVTVSEPGVGSQSATEVARAHNKNSPVLRESQPTTDLILQVFDVVADSAHAVGAQIGQILADLGPVHSGESCQFSRRDRDDAGFPQPQQCPLINWQPRDRGIGDSRQNRRTRTLLNHTFSQGRQSAFRRGKRMPQ